QVGEEGRAGEPLLGVRLDLAGGEIHVVRGLDSYVWEGHDSGGGVYLSRERRKWVRELVGTLALASCASLDELRDELICRLFHAVVGTRLPLSSVEAPLPAFSFGELFYCYRGLGGNATEGARGNATEGARRNATEGVPYSAVGEISPSEESRLL